MSYSTRNQWPASSSSSSSSRPSISPVVPPTYPSPQNYQHHRTPRGASEIIPRLYISDLAFAENPASLASHGITHIISAISSSVLLPPASVLHPYPPPRHLHVKVEDFPFAELAAHLPTTTAWIREAYRGTPNARVLVHCAEGVSRSVSVVAAFLIAQYGWTPAEAVQFIKSKRRVADPNFGFVQQLGEYARSLGR
ncbi:protein-tyrosine phosphatase-like protein [Lyophyllum atratum]|nr:protein-tyrosine phosphatase-like protein [Lyophyllum atratum]